MHAWPVFNRLVLNLSCALHSIGIWCDGVINTYTRVWASCVLVNSSENIFSHAQGVYACTKATAIMRTLFREQKNKKPACSTADIYRFQIACMHARYTRQIYMHTHTHTRTGTQPIALSWHIRVPKSAKRIQQWRKCNQTHNTYLHTHTHWLAINKHMTVTCTSCTYYWHTHTHKHYHIRIIYINTLLHTHAHALAGNKQTRDCHMQ